MAFISFAWTTAALVARKKTVTRREWSPDYARKFHAGLLVDAYDRQPRYGGVKVGTIRLTRDPYQQSTADAPPEDYAAEGFEYLEEMGAAVDGLAPKILWRAWKLYPREMWVVRFEVVDIDASWKARVPAAARRPRAQAGQRELWAGNEDRPAWASEGTE